MENKISVVEMCTKQKEFDTYNFPAFFH